MKRTQIYLDETQDRRLGERATAIGTTKSALIRGAIDLLLEGDDEETVRLAQFRSALRALRKRPPLDLPPGDAYVEDIRIPDAARLADFPQ